MEYISKNENETFDIAKKIAGKAKAGDIFALSGELGSGKTTFVKAFAKALGVKQEITSPTFVLLKQYNLPVAFNSKAKFLVHVDCYRMETVEDAHSIGLSEYFGRDDVIILIEWPEKIKEILPPNIINIGFDYLDEYSRSIKVENRS